MFRDPLILDQRSPGDRAPWFHVLQCDKHVQHFAPVLLLSSFVLEIPNFTLSRNSSTVQTAHDHCRQRADQSPHIRLNEIRQRKFRKYYNRLRSHLVPGQQIALGNDTVSAHPLIQVTPESYAENTSTNQEILRQIARMYAVRKTNAC